MSRRSGVFAILAAALLAVVVLVVPGRATPPATGDQTLTRGCAVRLGTQPVLHRNATHACPGFESAHYTGDGWLVIVFDGGGAVISVSVSPDETLVDRCIIAGGSGGGAWLSIRFKNACTGNNVHARDPYLHGDLSNVWVTVTQMAPS